MCTVRDLHVHAYVHVHMHVHVNMYMHMYTVQRVFHNQGKSFINIHVPQTDNSFYKFQNMYMYTVHVYQKNTINISKY